MTLKKSLWTTSAAIATWQIAKARWSNSTLHRIWFYVTTSYFTGPLQFHAIFSVIILGKFNTWFLFSDKLFLSFSCNCGVLKSCRGTSKLHSDTYTSLCWKGKRNNGPLPLVYCNITPQQASPQLSRCYLTLGLLSLKLITAPKKKGNQILSIQ